MWQNLRHHWVADQINNGGSILDVGGTERANIGNYVKNETVTVNFRRSLKPAIVADACHLPIRNKAFSTVTAISIIHQIKNRPQCLTELKRVAQDKVVVFDCQTRTLEVKHIRRKS